MSPSVASQRAATTMDQDPEILDLRTESPELHRFLGCL